MSIASAPARFFPRFSFSDFRNEKREDVVNKVQPLLLDEV